MIAFALHSHCIINIALGLLPSLAAFPIVSTLPGSLDTIVVHMAWAGSSYFSPAAIGHKVLPCNTPLLCGLIDGLGSRLHDEVCSVVVVSNILCSIFVSVVPCSTVRTTSPPTYILYYSPSSVPAFQPRFPVLTARSSVPRPGARFEDRGVNDETQNLGRKW